MPLQTPFELPWTLEMGDFFPAWELPGHDDRRFDGEKFVGAPLVFCFLPTEDAFACDALACAFRDYYPEFQRLGCNVVCAAAVPASVSQQYAKKLQPPYTLLADIDGSVTMACRAVQVRPGSDGKAVFPAHKTFILDPNKRVLRIYQGVDPQTHAQQVLEFLHGYVQVNQPRVVQPHAPVLTIPRLFSPQFCKQLIHIWETEGNRETGTMRQIGENSIEVIDHSFKIRRDHHLTEGPAKDQINHLLYHRARPEVKKAFAFELDHFEEFKIIRYDAEVGGYFRPHRDNTTYGGAHRVFAMSVNLNTEEFEGGNLRFPEYGPHCYRPGTGDAVIFSCTLLHEATDVLRGRRFALLAFLFGKEEVPVMQANRSRRIPGITDLSKPHQSEGTAQIVPDAARP